ncbi:MAG: hypothetical protein JXA06_08965 [Bacteroidetes bacterium]|nr:hypothetical protein [Bacteroidota bacterium]
MTTIVYLECRVEAILELLGDKGITLEDADINSTTHKIHAVQGDVFRHKIACRIRNPNFDIG